MICNNCKVTTRDLDLLNVIDVFSKFVWSIPIKDKIGKTMTESFEIIIKASKIKPEKLWVDNGTEF